MARPLLKEIISICASLVKSKNDRDRRHLFIDSVEAEPHGKIILVLSWSISVYLGSPASPPSTALTKSADAGESFGDFTTTTIGGFPFTFVNPFSLLGLYPDRERQ